MSEDDLNQFKLPQEVIQRFRSALLDGNEDSIDFSPQQIIEIASRSNLLSDFLKRFSTEINDPQLKSAIIEYIEDLSEGLENANDNTDAFIELVDRASFPIATTAVLSGITLLVSLGVTLGPLAILCGGTLGLAISGTGRTSLRLRVNKNKADIKKLRKFATKLRSLP